MCLQLNGLYIVWDEKMANYCFNQILVISEESEKVITHTTKA